MAKRLCDRNTFQIQNTTQIRKELLPSADSLRDVLHVLTVENFVFNSAAEFLCEDFFL